MVVLRPVAMPAGWPIHCREPTDYPWLPIGRELKARSLGGREGIAWIWCGDCRTQHIGSGTRQDATNEHSSLDHRSDGRFKHACRIDLALGNRPGMIGKRPRRDLRDPGQDASQQASGDHEPERHSRNLAALRKQRSMHQCMRWRERRHALNPFRFRQAHSKHMIPRLPSMPPAYLLNPTGNMYPTM